MNKNCSNLRLRAKGLRPCTGYIQIPAKLKSSKGLRDYQIVAKRKFQMISSLKLTIAKSVRRLGKMIFLILVPG